MIKKLFSWPLKIVTTVVIIIVGWYLLGRLNLLPSFSGLFKSKNVTIENTPVLIKEMNSISELMTISAYDELVIDTTKPAMNIPNILLPIPTPSINKLVLIARGQIIAGIHLKELQPENIMTKEDTVLIELPPARITDAIINPSGFEIFMEKGNWSATEVTELKKRAKQLMIERNIQQGLLKKASERATAVLTGFLKNVGYKNIIITLPK